MKKICLVLLAAVLMFSAAGCGKKNSRQSSNEIAVGIAQDLGSSLSPYKLSTAGAREILFNIFEGLYKTDSSGNYVPALAEKVDISEDGLRYVFTLRDGVKFHNGAVMTAADVTASFERCAAETVDANLSAALKNVASVTEDGKTVTVTLQEANSDFMAFVVSVYIVPKDYSEQETAPVGSGPFRFVSRKVQENIVFERFEDYWGEKAKLSKVTFRVYETGTALVTAMDAGQVDFVPHLTSAQLTNLNKNYQVLEGTMNLVQALYLNNAAAPLDQLKVRQALCYAVDVQGMLDLTADGHGTRVGSAMFPAFGKYFDEALTDYYPHDIEKAKALLAEAGYADGFDLTIMAPSNYTNHIDTAEVLAEQLKAVGIRATVQQIEWNNWLTDVYQGRNFQATVVGFDASTLTAGAMLNRYVSSSGKNLCNFSSAEYDQLIAQAAETTDEAKRTELFRRAEAVLTEQAASVFLQDMADFVAVSVNLSGYRFYPQFVMDLSTVAYVK